MRTARAVVELDVFRYAGSANAFVFSNLTSVVGDAQSVASVLLVFSILMAVSNFLADELCACTAVDCIR